jgi:exopolysaccharide biosynthesis polyprenyl glycosylphosphotransferase
MIKRFSLNYALLSLALDAALTVAALAIAHTYRTVWLGWVWPEAWLPGRAQAQAIPPNLWLWVVLLWQGVFAVTSVYDPRRNYRAVDEFQALAFAEALACLALAGLLYLSERAVARWLFVFYVVLSVVFLFGWRVIARVVFRLRHGGASPQRVLIVGAGEVGQRVAETIAAHRWTGLTLVGYLDDDPAKRDNGNGAGGGAPTDAPVLGTVEEAPRLITEHAIDEVVIALPQRAWARLNQLVVALHALPVHLRVVPDYFALTLHRAEAEDFAGIPMIDLRAPALNPYQRLVKRVFDLVVGSVLTLIALPIIGVLAIAIKLDSPGPVFYRAPRVGENNRTFNMLKLRSMVADADARRDEVLRTTEDGTITFKRPDDPRITRVGRFIRRTSLDELPQLFNVLRGDMSLVGPRPELPWLVDLYEPWQRKRFAVPQGMTGWWQVNGRSDKEMHRHTDEDLYYVQHYSLWLDLMILVRTVFVVLRGRGAY